MSLKPGDKVIGSFQYSIGRDDLRRLGTVKSVGKISVTCLFGDDHPYRFNRNGHGTVGGYHCPRIVPATDALIAEVREENRVKRIHRTLKAIEWQKLSAEQRDIAFDALRKVGIIPSPVSAAQPAQKQGEARPTPRSGREE
jgi:hypothetical protein